MFSSIPMVQSATAQPGGLATTYNALAKSSLDNQILGAQAQYAPYQAYADAQLKNQQAIWTPYQYRMQALPMMLMAAQGDPAKQQQILQMMNGPIAGSGNAMNMGGPNIPLPGQPSQGSNPLGHGLAGMLWNKLTGDGQQQASNPMAQMPPPGGPMGDGQSQGGSSSYPTFGANNQATPQDVDQAIARSGGNNGNAGYQPDSAQPNASTTGSPIVPGTMGGPAAIVGRSVLPLEKMPLEPGDQIPDPNNPGHTISVPTSRQLTKLQNMVSAGQRAVPQLQSLPKLWGPYLTLPGKAQVLYDKAKNLLIPGSDSENPSNYQDAKMTAFTTVESYLNSLGVPVTVEVQHKLNNFIEPALGEGNTGYTNRIQRETDRIIQNFVNQAKHQISQGYATAPTATGQTQVARGGGGGGMNAGSNGVSASQPQANSGNAGSGYSLEFGNASDVANANKKVGYDPTSILDYKYPDGAEGQKQFVSSFNNLNPVAKKQVMDEMHRRGLK